MRDGKPSKLKTYQNLIIAMMAIGIVDILRLYVYTGVETTFNQPIGLTAILLMTVLGLILRNEFFYGIGIAMILPSYLLAINNIINNNINYIFNVVILVVGCFVFLTQKIDRPWHTFIAVAISEYLIFLPKFSLSESNISVSIGQTFPSYFYIAVLIGGFLMPLLKKLKNMSDEMYIRYPERKIIPKSRLQRKIDRIPYKGLKNNMTLIIMLTAGGIMGIVKAAFLDNPYWYTVSTWTIVISFMMLFMYSSVLSSEVIAITPSLICLIIWRFSILSLEEWLKVDLVYHGIIILIGLYLLFIRRDARWEYIFIFGVILKTVCFLLNLIIPDYLIHLEQMMYIGFIETVMVSVLYFVAAYRKPKIYKKLQNQKYQQNSQKQQIIETLKVEKKEDKNQ